MVMSARARRSVKACQRVMSTSSARRASSWAACRGGGIATAHPASATPTRRLLRSFRSTLHPAQPRLGVVDLLAHAVGGRIELERFLPGGQRVLLMTVLSVRIAEVLEDDGVFLRLLDGPLELAQGVRVAALLVIRPAQAVEEVAVVGLEIEGARDEPDRLVEVLAALGIHVADVVVGFRVLGIEGDDVTEAADGVVEPGLLFADDAELEVQA